jgi:curli biogenesis system outer membrane secretion channel CsgG
MKKTVLSLLFITFIKFIGLAQEEHFIGILPIKYEAGNEDMKNAAALVSDEIYNQFIQSGQVRVVEREFFNDLKNEKFLTSEVDFVDGVTYSKTKSVGAKQLLVGKVSSFKLDEDQTMRGNYKCTVSVGVRLVDVETGQVVHSYTLENKKSIFAGDIMNSDLLKAVLKSTKGEAVKEAVGSLKKSIQEFANTYFPAEFQLKRISLINEKNNKAEQVEIRVGNNKGAKAKQRYYIKEKMIDEGEVNYSTVGEIEIIEVNGANLSTAKIIKGGDIIKSKTDAGIKLVALLK